MKSNNRPRKSSVPFPLPVNGSSMTFYLLIVMVAFASCLFKGEAYFGDDLLSIYGPQRLFFKAALLQGHWPLWGNSLFEGQPFWADPNVMGLYPFSLPLLLLPMGLGMGLFYAFHLLLGFLGAHLWIKSLNLSEKAARVGALAFGLSGFFWWEIIHPPILAAFAWLPWWGWGLECLARTLKRSWAFTAGMFFCLIFISGSFQMTLGALYAGGLYFFIRFIKGRLAGGRVDWKRITALVLAFIWGSLPLWALWIPTSEFFSFSTRIFQPFDFLGFNADLCLTPGDLIQFLFPVKAFDPGTGGPRPYQALLGNAGCLGVWVFFLMGLSFQGKRKRAARWAAGAALLGLLIGFGKYFPLFKLLCEFVAGFGLTRAPFRFLFLFVAAGSILAALGWARVEAMTGMQRRKLRFGILGYGSVLLLVGIGEHFITPGFIVGLLAGGVGLMAALWNERFSKAGYWIFAGSLAVSMIANGGAITLSPKGPDSNFDFVQNRPELAELKQKTGLGRAFIGDAIPYPVRSQDKGFNVPLPTNVAYAIDLRHVKGYNPLSLWKTSQIYNMPIVTLSRLMAVQLIATGTQKAFSPPGFLAGQAGPVYFYYAKDPFPYVYAPNRFEVVPSDEGRLALMGQKDFNPYVLSYFSQAPPAETPATDLSKLDDLTYQLTRDDPDEQVFQVQRKQSGWTVFSEVVYPGWKVWVDGKRTTLLTANHIFRTVYVPAGGHEVRFSYEPVWWTPIRVGLVIWCWSVSALLWRPWRKWALGA
jgi:hypothetical protein